MTPSASNYVCSVETSLYERPRGDEKRETWHELPTQADGQIKQANA